MATPSQTPASGSPLAKAFARDGYAFPIRALAADQATSLRRRLERAEADAATQGNMKAMVTGLPHLVMPEFHDIVRDPAITDPVSEILGQDLLVWGCSFFTKEPRTKSFVSWHQDLTYWGLDDVDKVTAWVALSPATLESGCMRFVSGSHTQQIVPHKDTFDPDNLLTRGQEVAVEVKDEDAIDVELQPGEMSLHHGRIFHASHPNASDDRRIGLAIRYIKPSMRQTSGVKTFAVLARGEDRVGNFELAARPEGGFSDADVERCREAFRRRESILYSGATDDGRRKMA
ncbi:MAG: phytanoyl-CoA dioxygenase family protein [Thalassobaculaceae bacterium]|nr:phytanoyl-CoA dioxygenase family protein [Thalassobaculaceae bacterium]